MSIEKKARLDILISIIYNWRKLSENEIDSIMTEFERIPRDEWSRFLEESLSDEALGNEILSIGKHYQANPSLLTNIILSLGNMIERYGLNVSDEIFNFYIECSKIKKGKVRFYISLFLPDFPQFCEYKEKWDYILSIPTFAPKKKSRNIFYMNVKHLIKEIPKDLKREISAIFEDWLNDESIGKFTKNDFLELIEKLA